MSYIYNIAIVISAYNEEKNINKLYHEIMKNIQKSKKINNYSIVFINDNSTDLTGKKIKDLIIKNKNITQISVNKPTAKGSCLQLGFNSIDEKTDLVFMMDADLQDDPKELDKFIEKIEEGYDLVSGYKKVRLDNLEKRTASKIYNKILNLIFKMNLHDHNCGFKCFKKEVLKDLKIKDNLHRFITVLTYYNGYKVGEIAVTHHKRLYGKSKYGFARYFIGFKDMIRVKLMIKKYKKK